MDSAMENQLREETHFWIDLANEVLKSNMPYPKVSVDKRGTVAGTAYTYSWKIRYNPVLARENWDKFRDTTVPHEVAHLVADGHFGKPCGHGREWKWVMSHVFNREPTRCHSYDVTNARARKVKRYSFQCGCRIVTVGPKRFRQIMTLGCEIYCLKCKVVLNAQNYIGEVA